ncbi:MetQ/NlpA family ABC transporter substrate-binding protein [Aneurinibacillus thermoaerophilus]|uniref:Lipoprotein n=2 Tax=Aneurinibacillus thermoaerophilus TaxID=143495 RepID=A0A1G7ZD32_ANETH|nr:MetQ/NlpA family ABC transporter substrate-binding protein [Aneurinibacillus thermoaerophilus]MED0676587.1 MetQ/NlpA family ABC transporter substrate-binding protein [Aneurinibacillus thermoaerophilus]MED0680390.1 MetQ/NlpA family ABC transporter substrate-binding protein [Aneurinibacillus thermoaerophilus]MED0735914.1 MetQ/NlpA family ABC transporter substrate-binding protein [Aneurinibacillus thermoaerophilus]MED0762779.1 MetQ/NlpA family ABC transporter substrate-binding protein [Aneurini
MKTKSVFIMALILIFSMIASACGSAKEETAAAGKANGEKKELKIGATAGPYSDQINKGIKPILEKKGYKIEVVEFSDYVQPNKALAEGSLDANVFQNPLYLKKFAQDHNLHLTGVLEVPTAPIGLYSRKHKSLNDIQEGATVTLPNDPVNQARALTMLDQFGWIKLKEGIDPTKASEKDIAQNIKKLTILPLEAAQLPRSLDDADYAFINGNFAIASGLKLKEAVALEKTPPHYMIVLTVRTEDKDKMFVKDLVEAYKSSEFKEITDKEFEGFVKPDYQK